MKALCKNQNKKGIWLTDVAKPTPKYDEVLVKVNKTAICGTDLHIYLWDDWARQNIPLGNTIGHEFVGTIVELGSQVQDLKIGMQVSAEGHIVCGHCRNCAAGRLQKCANSKGLGVQLPGAFAEYIVVPYKNIWVHKKSVDTDVAALFDPLGNAVHSILQFDLVGEDVLITGAGPIGLMATSVCRFIGARNIVVSDINPKRLEIAKTMGASAIFNPKTDNLDKLKQKLNIVEGFDIGLEMAGNPQAFQQLVDNMAYGGRISLLGLQPQNTTINWQHIIFKMLTIKGIYGREMFETWYKMSAMIEQGLNISPVISHRLPYRQFQQGFDALEQGEANKVILNWE